eukprot:scaffold5664_cov94-Skeletonema_dohrnii-CCMP3373.AAC.1
MAEEFIYMGEPNPVVPPGAIRVIVDESVNIIPAFAFEGNRSIVELICRDGVKTVKERAFDECISLTRVIMPGVEVVAKDAFADCKALTYVECGKLERIEEWAFACCESLRSIDFSSVDFVGERAFFRCVALKGAKFGCDKLERVDIVGGEVLHVNIAIAAFLMEKWRKDMNEAIDSINQILPDTPAGDDDDVGEKAVAIREWITNVLRKFAHYQTQHRLLLKEAMTTVELAMWKKSINERDNVPER